MSTGQPRQSTGKPAEPLETNRGWPFRWMFPLGQLALCAILLWPARPRIAYELHLPWLAGQPLGFQFGGPVLRAFGRWSESNGMQTVTAMNLPAVVFEIPLMLFEKDWASHGYRAGRAIAWPILAMVFWWIAGRGAEALAAARRKNVGRESGGWKP
jgi:hypothetical protein